MREFCPGDSTAAQRDIFVRSHQLYLRLKSSAPGAGDFNITAAAVPGEPSQAEPHRTNHPTPSPPVPP